MVKEDKAMMDEILSSLSVSRRSTHSALRDSMRDFQNIEHRLEHVASVGGIAFINDSKATTVNATWWSIESQKVGLTWIVGGAEGNYNYETLYSTVMVKVKNIICFGGLSGQIMNCFGSAGKSVMMVEDLKEAVMTSSNVAQKGEVVLFSPACSSFDTYNNYADRGLAFKKAVKEL